jgi:hypothetical protein
VFVAVVALVAVGFALVTGGAAAPPRARSAQDPRLCPATAPATVAWHATTVAVIGLIIGVLLGIVVGRHRGRCRRRARSRPIRPGPCCVVLLMPVVLIAVNLVASVPARRRPHPPCGVLLRSE